MKGQRIIVNDLGRAPAGGGTPVSLVDNDGNEVGRYANVVDAYHAGASGAFDNIDAMPAGTSVPHPGTTATDAPSPFDYSTDPAQSAASGIETPLYDKGFTTPFAQHVTSDPVQPMNVGNGASFNPGSYPNVDITTPPPLTHPTWAYPRDPNS